jgi:hypothetical protein
MVVQPHSCRTTANTDFRRRERPRSAAAGRGPAQINDEEDGNIVAQQQNLEEMRLDELGHEGTDGVKADWKQREQNRK